MIPIKPANATWTDEQWQAIYEDNKNIIVSAGAGSGKTAVLTERVIRKLKDGVNINELLILTFTKAAAQEMADRIRKKIKKIPELKEQLNLLDSSYITTFDSFALSIVKKYHYLLNVSPNIKIIDSNVIEIQKNEIMDQLFLEYYDKQEPLFLEMIQSFCTKDDTDIRHYILNISNKLDQLSNKQEYLEKYLFRYFDESKIEEDIQKYFELIKEKITIVKEKVKEIGYLDGEFANKLETSITPLYNISSYDDLITKLNIKLPIAPRGSDEELKKIKSEISDILKEMKQLAIYESEEEIKNSIKSTYSTVQIIIELILEFSNRIMEYKRKNNSYEFNDIAILAIQVVKESSTVREELKNYFKEIMIDEYQDTNDLQEEFISMISSHNVYMVGDIKQSIYRFRNANPYIFKNKYDTYSSSIQDLKIDLNKNFRSRKEVLDNINTIFTLIMNDDIGGADYLTSHQMIFGNRNYLKEKVDHSNDMDIYQYLYDKSLGFTKDEIEAFMIAQDIIKKKNDHYQIFDKDSEELRNVRYEDFAIIMDRATTFDLYKKVFSYFKIPITLLKDEKMNEEDDIHVLSNLIRLIIKVNENNWDTEAKYLFVSIMRSFLYQENDETIFDYFRNNNFKDSKLYEQCRKLANEIDYITIHQLLDKIIIEFHYYESYLTLGNIHNGIVKFTKLRELGLNLEELGYDIKSFSEYLVKLLKMGYKMEYKVPDTGADAVKIMTIHKSKGLEYPVCYFSGLYKEFNISDLKERFLIDKEYGIIVPYFKEGIGQTIYKELLKQKYLKEEISEKIRLFYVALTRAREKIILIKPMNEKGCDESNITVLDNSTKNKYRSLANMVDSIEFRIRSKYQTKSLEDLKLTKEYAMINQINYKEKLSKKKEQLEVQELHCNNIEKKLSSFSKKIQSLIRKEEYELMLVGSRVHEALETIDLKNPDYENITDNSIKKMIQNFLKQPLLKNIKDATIYQEYEFIYEENETEYHGMIDLMLEYSDHIDIVDYKLKNIQDESYLNQLKGYQKFVVSKTNKKVFLYLYSLLDNIICQMDK
ncbi:MAG: UvrD-helicase domain-containing protein [Candidatus Aphodocola sp.]